MERGLARPRGVRRRLPRRLAGAQRRAPPRPPTLRRPCPSGARPPRAPKISAHEPEPRPGAARRPPRPPRADRGRGRPLLRRALEGVRLGRDDRASSGTSTTSSRPRTWSTSRTRCAPTSPRPSLPPGAEALAAAPDVAQGGFRVPSPGAGGGGMSELLELTAAQAVEAIRARRGRARGALERLPRARGRRRAQRLHLGRRRAEPPQVDRDAPLAGVPVAVKDLFATEGIPSQAGSKILEDYRPPYSATASSASPARARRCWARPTRTSSRWAPRRSTPPTGRR